MKKQSFINNQNHQVKLSSLSKLLSGIKQKTSVSVKYFADNPTFVTARHPYKYSSMYVGNTYRYIRKRNIYKFVIKAFKRIFLSAILSAAAWWVVWNVPEVKSALGLVPTVDVTGGGASGSSWEVFFSVFGIVYAILVGMLIVEALSRYNELQSLVAQEANAISDIDDFLVYLEKGDKAKSEIKKYILEYIDLVLGEEWEVMEKRSTPEEVNTPPALMRLMKAICNVKTDVNVCKHAQNLMMDRVAEITTYRTERIEKSEEYVAPPMRILVAGLSVAIVVGLILMVVNPLWLHLWMVVVVAIALASLYEFIIDLNRPFGTKEGDDLWAVETKSFDQIRVKVAKNRAYL